MPRTVTILGQDIAPDSSHTLHIDVAPLHTRTPVEAPVFVERARDEGPVLLLVGGVHGDEVTGIDIVRRVIRGGYHRPRRGTVVCIPVLNIFGFVNLSRAFPDGRDLNRVFPGSATGSLASQFASLFRRAVMPAVDVCLDFHSGGAERRNAPQTRCVFSDARGLEVARAFGAPFVVQSKYIGKSIREAFMRAGKTAVVFEGGKSMDFDLHAAHHGVLGVRRVMTHLDMIDAAPDLPPAPDMIEVSSSRWLRAPGSGLWHAFAKLGAWVDKGDVIGMLCDPYGGAERPVRATWPGFVFCVNTAAVINRGDALCNVSVAINSATG